MTTLDVIHVFLASPGDLAEEREAARHAVEEVNRRLAGYLGLRLELYCWEYEAPGLGRAQARINTNLAEAGLFIGMLWRRWGTPSGDGPTSGFAEEWELARQRAEAGDDVEVWLFFKDVEPAQKQDPGTELQRVLDFRHKVETEHEALYHTFPDAQAWRDKLLTLLMEFVAKRVKARTSDEPDKPRPVVEPSAQVGEAEPQVTDGAVGQVAEALGAMQRALQGEGHEPLAEGDALRVLLAAFQWVSDTHTAETIDTHELNLFYKGREQLLLTLAEENQLVRSMLVTNVVRPGWFWLRGGAEASASETLMRLAASDRNVAVRVAAVKLLHEPRALGGQQVAEAALIKALLGDGSERMRAAVLDFAARSDSPETLIVLQAEWAKPDARPSMLPDMARILLRQAPDDALALAADEGFLGRLLEDEYAADPQRFSDEAIRRLWDANPECRHLALRLEAGRGSVNHAHAQEAAAHDGHDRRFKGLGVELMLENGWPVAEADFDAIQNEFTLASDVAHRRRVLRAGTLPDDELRFAAVYWLADAAAVFEALCARHPDETLDHLREGLADGFADYRERSAEALRNRFGADAEKLIEEKRYQARDFTISALRALAEIGTPDDAALAEPYLRASEPAVRYAALETLAGLAPETAATAAQAIALSGTDTRDERTHAAELALRLRPDAAAELADADNASVVRLAVPHLTGEPGQIERLRELLDGDDDETRAAAARRLSVLLDRDELLNILNAYCEQASYYYNVVSLLDASIYAPEPYRGWYLNSTAPF